jgi:pseudouridine-5'-phosphate glycosidase
VGTSELPSFFSRSSGLPLEHRIDTAEEGAAIVRTRFDALAQGGLVFAVPPPEAEAIPPELIEAHLAHALEAAQQAGISGKAVTPFLLGELVRRTGGATLRTNVALLENNARFAGALAAALTAS